MTVEPLFSVVIPSRDNRVRLERTLGSIARARVDHERIEVVVADDGSSDGTAELLAGTAFPFHVRRVPGDWSNQSAATNAAIDRARGRYLLLSASDILFHPDLIAEHLREHERAGEREILVLGDLPYAPELEITPFMFYLVTGGYQFAYYLIRDHRRVPPNFSYAPNLSVRRSTVQRVGGFDERFPFGCQDTDFGIRMAQAGVRMVFNPRAIGFHNHPVRLDGFLRRQEMAGEGLVHLARKHPDHEGGHLVWDQVVRGYLAYSATQRERDLCAIELLEREVPVLRGWRELWTRSFVEQQPADAFDDEQQARLRRVGQLFGAYDRVLTAHWGLGVLREAVKVDGRQTVQRRLDARLGRLQMPISARRAIVQRLAKHRLTAEPPDALDHLTTRILHGIDGYAAAVRSLEGHELPQVSVHNQQLFLVAPAGVLSGEEIARLRQAAEVLVAPTTGEGVVRALERADGDLVIVTHARVRVAERRAAALSSRVFERFQQVAVLGGGVREADTVRYGLRLIGHGAEPLRRPAAGCDVPLPVGAALADWLVVRREALAEADPATLPGEAWNVELCRRLAARGTLALHVPDWVVDGDGETGGAAARPAPGVDEGQADRPEPGTAAGTGTGAGGAPEDRDGSPAPAGRT